MRRLFYGMLLSSIATAANAQNAGVQPQQQPNQGRVIQWFPVPTNARFITGDSWEANGLTFRLYGVQACLRGTFFTNKHGQKRDCGEASLVVLASLIKDLSPQCFVITSDQAKKLVHISCVAVMTKGSAPGSRLDLGVMMISTGWAFSALTAEGKPVHEPYLVAQLTAQKSKKGLWEFPDVVDPNTIIMRAVKNSPPAVNPGSGAQ